MSSGPQNQQPMADPTVKDEPSRGSSSERPSDSDATITPEDETQPEAEKDFLKGKSWRFWAIFPALMVSTLLAAVEVTVTSTAMPTIVHHLDVGTDYVWIVNAFLLTSTAFQPITGQLADVWGRRWLTIGSVAVFTLGSGIAGGANDGKTLIAGRAIQGLGSGSLNLLIDLIICDLVPLRERGRFIGLISVVFAIGLFLGPFIGGVLVQHSSWRWVFWINLPIGGVSLALLYAFLQVTYKKVPMKERLRRIDYIGNLLVIASTMSILFALAYAGSIYAWSDARVIVPLVLGFVGMAAFHTYEASKYCKHPTIPPHLFANRTSAISFFVTFIHALMTLWVLYFLPVYFQAVLGSTPTRSGVQLLPTVLGMVPAAVIAGLYLTHIGKYRPLHVAGMLFMVGGLGSFTALKADSSMAVWVILQIITSLGTGTLATALLPAVQAGLTDDDNATSTATWSYIRSYGAIWGVTIPAVVFNNQFSKHLHLIGDQRARQALANGNAYANAEKTFIASFPEPVRSQIIQVYTKALKMSWIVAAVIVGGSTLFVFLEKEIPLRESLRTEFGIKEKAKPADAEEATTKEKKEETKEAKN